MSHSSIRGILPFLWLVCWPAAHKTCATYTRQLLGEKQLKKEGSRFNMSLHVHLLDDQFFLAHGHPPLYIYMIFIYIYIYLFISIYLFSYLFIYDIFNYICIHDCIYIYI